MAIKKAKKRAKTLADLIAPECDPHIAALADDVRAIKSTIQFVDAILRNDLPTIKSRILDIHQRQINNAHLTKMGEEISRNRRKFWQFWRK
jgi:quinolinate synthase